jgi:hypothetical protein
LAFQQDFDAGQDLWPTTRYGNDKLRLAVIDLMNHCQLHQLVQLFERDRCARVTFGVQVGIELVVPLQNQALGGSISRTSPESATRPSGMVNVQDAPNVQAQSWQGQITEPLQARTVVFVDPAVGDFVDRDRVQVVQFLAASF